MNNNDIAFAALALGVVVNLIALATLIWKMGQWTGTVRLLLKRHDEYHESHFALTRDLDRRVSRLQGAAEAGGGVD